MNIQIALIRQEESFDGALLVDGKFRRALTGPEPAGLIGRLLGGLLSGLPTGGEILVNVAVTLPAEEGLVVSEPNEA
jgi:hypothetical protein